MTITRDRTRSGARRERISIERTYKARIDDVWDLWTTKEGIESWWGPGGFSVSVRSIDLRPGGELRYAMTATAPAQVEFMKKAGIPLTNEHLIVFTDVQPPTRLAYSHLVDFVPGVDAYEAEMVVEMHEAAGQVHLVLTIERMHDDVWTERKIAGWEMELGKLAKVLEART